MPISVDASNFFFFNKSNLFVKNKEFPSKKKDNPTTYRCWEEIQEALEPRGGTWGGLGESSRRK